MRKISLDTETTGLLYYEGHRIIEIGCIEIINKKITNNKFHTYINPLRFIDKSAKKITGLTDHFLKNKPLFKDIIDNFFKFLENSNEIIIHNANFDINFINNELQINKYKFKDIRSKFNITDSLKLARKIHPGKKNNLNALCKRYNIKTTERILHGALIDANLLAQVYIEMTSKQEQTILKQNTKISYNIEKNKNFKQLKANKQELKKHIQYINYLKKTCIKT